MAASSQLLVYRFDAFAGLEGRLVTAIERIEAGGALQILDVLFVSRERATAELFAVDVRRAGAGGMIAPLLDFRLDLTARRRATGRALARDKETGQLIRALGETLEPGEAVAALLVAHEWARLLADAVDRAGGRARMNVFVEPTALAALTPELLAAVGPAG